jgi:predicted DNA-binding transcriptional regulator YafY
VARLVDATRSHRRATITYHSFSSRRVKGYTIEPYRLAYGNGGFYVYAFVREYRQMRTFAAERIRKLVVSEETFNPVQKVADEPFVNSLGVHSGKPEHVEIEFTERVAPYIEERTWHSSQKIAKRADGSILLSLDVCLDWTLSSWILGFGPFARVVRPPKLASRSWRKSRKRGTSTRPGSPSRRPRRSTKRPSRRSPCGPGLNPPRAVRDPP